MKIMYGSDLHLEFGGNVKVPECDILLLAGDIFTPHHRNMKYDEGVRSFFEDCSINAGITYMILGNHEHYNGVFNTTALSVQKVITKFPNVFLLDNQSALFGNKIALFGTTLWTDGDCGTGFYLENAMNDFHIIRTGRHRFTVQDMWKENLLARRELKSFCTQYPDYRKIILTHHLPSMQCVAPMYQGSILNTGFANTQFDYFIEEQEEGTKWIFGHTHHPVDFYINKCHMLCNPRGYKGLEPVAKQFEFKELVL